MSKVVLDSSAILAYLLEEHGYSEITDRVVSQSVASSVNIAEVHAKLVLRGGLPDQAWVDTLSAVRETVPFDDEQAKISGTMVAQTKHLGLSFGDRACLALGIALGAPVYTADRQWKKLRLNVRIHVIR
jgi:ribonuclease VapC